MISIFLSIAIVIKLETNFLVNTILLGSSFYLFFITVKDFFISKARNYSQKISHLGFSLLILSILLNNFFSSEIITNIKIDEVYSDGKTKIFLEKVEKQKRENYDSIIGHFQITDQNQKVEFFKPELRIYNQPITVTSEADIKTNFFYDKFLVINVVQNQNYFNLRYQEKPFMMWIWFSVILISFGGILNLVILRNEK